MTSIRYLGLGVVTHAPPLVQAVVKSFPKTNLLPYFELTDFLLSKGFDEIYQTITDYQVKSNRGAFRPEPGGFRLPGLPDLLQLVSAALF